MPRPAPFAPGPLQWRRRHNDLGPNFYATGVLVEMEFNGPGGGWTNITNDVHAHTRIKIRRGMRGGGPLDRVASTGTCELVLHNTAQNSGGLVGYYSPDHGNKRGGFAIGAGLRVSFHHAIGATSTTYVLFVGTIDKAKPTPGIRGEGGTAIVAVDYMEELSRFRLSNVAIQTTATADEVLQAVLDEMPRPVPTDFDTGSDTYAYALDSPGSAYQECVRLAFSEYGYVYQKRTGELRFEARSHRLSNLGTPFQPAIVGLSAIQDTSRVINVVQAIAHPRTADTDYIVLGSLADQPLVAPGQSLTFKIPYIDSENTTNRIGAVDVQPMVANLDYSMSITQAVATGTPDTPATLRPNGEGFYTGTGTAASLADESDSTGISYPGPSIKRSVTLTDVSAANNAAVSGVKIKVRINYTPGPGNIDGSGFGGFFIINAYARLGGVEAQIFQAGTTAAYNAYGPSGVHEVEYVLATPPGGGVWTVAAVNACEFVWEWNVGGDVTALSLARVEMRLLYASAVEELDRTDDFTVTHTLGGSEATVTVTNGGAAGAYVTKAQVRGKGIYRDQPHEIEVRNTASIGSFGERHARFDMQYQSNTNLVKLVADYILSRHKDAITYVDSCTLLSDYDDAQMAAVLGKDISDFIRVVEAVTGIDGEYWINGVTIDIHENNRTVAATWILSPADETDYWLFDVPGRTEFNTTNVFAPI